MSHIPGYRDLAPLGRGGFSEVHRAYQERFDRWVAVKLLSFTLTDEGVQRRFLRECQLAGRVSAHPHVATIYDAGITPDGRPYMAMELYDGGSAADRVEAGGPFGVVEALRAAVALAGALESAHRAGVIHRDVKPGNVLLTGYGHPALTDFGLSVLSERQEVSVGADALSPYHAPPEVLDRASPTPASDVYSLASTTYTMLAGRAPHQLAGDDTLAALLARIVNADAPALGRTDAPASLVEALRHGLARDPRARTPSALAFAGEVQRAQADLGVEPTEPIVITPPPGTEVPAPGAPGGFSTTVPTADATVPQPDGPSPGPGPGAVPVAPVMAVQQPPGPGAPGHGGPGPGGPPDAATVHRDHLLQPRPTHGDDAPKRSRRAALIVAGVLLVAGAGGAAALIATRDDDGGPAETTSTTESDETTTTEEEPPDTDDPGPTSTTSPTPEELDIADVVAPEAAMNWVDGCENTVGFEAGNMIDGEDETAWRMEGDATGQSLTLTLEGERQVTSVGLVPGYASVDECNGTDNFAENRRPTSVTWVFEDGTEATQPLTDSPELQTADVEATTSTITLRIDGVTAEQDSDFTAISELAVEGLDDGP